MRLLRHRLVRRLLYLAILTGVLYATPSGHFIVMPGQATDLGGIVHVQGGQAGPGELDMLTVSTREANLLLYVYGLLDPRAELVPRDEIIPEGKDIKDYFRQTDRLMAQSQVSAKVAALRFLGYDADLTGKGARVVEIIPGGPAEGRLVAGDVIVALDGQEIRLADELLAAMAARRAGDEVAFTVVRNGERLRIPMVTVEHPDHAGRAAVKIRVETDGLEARLPVAIDIRPGAVSGPSAGLMFALEIIDQLDGPGDLAGGRLIAGTGTISPDGKVGPIGAIRQKVLTAERAGAALMLVPSGNADEARRAARRLRVIAVDDLDDAVRALKTAFS